MFDDTAFKAAATALFCIGLVDVSLISESTITSAPGFISMLPLPITDRPFIVLNDLLST